MDLEYQPGYASKKSKRSHSSRSSKYSSSPRYKEIGSSSSHKRSSSNLYYNSSAGVNRRGQMWKELGYVDKAVASYNYDTTGTIAHINLVPQGSAVTQRVGKKIEMKSLTCRGYVNNGSTATFTDIALLIVYDKRPTGALPLITDILVTANSIAFNNDANSGRFVILRRWTKTLAGIPATSNGDGPVADNDFYLNLRGLPTVYKATGAGDMGDIEQGALYAVSVGNAAAGTGAATGSLGFRLRFVDV